MNALWAGMMLMAIIYGTFHGTIPAVTQAALDSAKEAVSLCITMLGILSFWMGLMQVGSASGLIGRMTRGIRPALRCLFPGIPEEHPALEQIAVNCIANVLGLGWAATPAGLKAMKDLENLEEERILEEIQIVKRDSAGYVETVQIGAETYSGDAVRYALGVPSPAFSLEEDGDEIRCVTYGRGHGYGLSQYGAGLMAENGSSAEEILKHYFKNIQIVSE